MDHVYAYYFPAYEERARRDGKDVWECKVGRSTKEAGLRVGSQSGTALPELPVIALTFETPSAVSLELALHSILRLRGRTVEGAPGREWFFTNPAEIMEIVTWINPVDLQVVQDSSDRVEHEDTSQ